MRQWRTGVRRLSSRARAAASSRPGRHRTPAELRVYLPLLWPDGPDGPVDETALRALGRDYARAGRVMDELLADLDILCSVVGIGASSGMVEASSVAWSDAFLAAVAADTTPDDSLEAVAGPAAAVAEVAQRLAGFRTSVWGDLAPSGRLLLVAWSPARERERGRGQGQGQGSLLDELDMVAHDVRRTFPGALVVQQPRHRRVIAAVAETETTEAGVRALRARCAELVTSSTITVTAVDARAEDDVARHLFGAAG